MATMRPDGPTRQRDLAAEVERLEHALRLTEARSREALSEMEHLRAQFLQAQKMEPVGRMTAGLAHDFKNTLTLIAGYTDRLLQRVDDPAGREDLAEIRAACNRAIGLSQQLLAFGRHGTASLATLSLNAILADAGKMLRRMLPANVDLAIRPAAAPDLVTANAGQLHQVLLNLVVNARDAMPAGGRLVIETRNADVEPGSAAAASGVAPGDYVRLSVSDTGVGMDGATRKRALEPFFTTKEGRTGTGLGLSTVVEIVSRSHGSIAIESAPGRGTSVLISLPRAAGATEPAAVAAAPGPESRRRVLVVDPDEQVRRLLVDVTSGAGFDVEAAADLSAAEALAGAGRWRAIVVDLALVERDGGRGWGAFRSRAPDAKVAVMSGAAGGTPVTLAGQPGVVATIAKPIVPRQVLRALLDLTDSE